MKRLILMRHAKSDWHSGSASDHARPLNARGRAASRDLGDWLREAVLSPSQALVSTAERTRETYARLRLEPECAVVFERALYLASAQVLFDRMRQATGETVLMLGHNPGIADAAAAMVAHPPDHQQFDRYPTGATLVVRFPVDQWSDVIWGSGTTERFVVPRELNKKGGD